MAQDVNATIQSDIVYNVLFYLVTGKTTYVRTFKLWDLADTILKYRIKKQTLC